MAERTTISIDTGGILKVIFIILALGFFYLIRDVLVIVFFAIVIASAVEPAANWMESRKIPRLLGVLVLYLVVFVLIVSLLSLLIPFVSGEVGQLTQALPKFLTKISGALEKAQETTNNRYFDFMSEIQNILDSFTLFLQTISRSVLNLIVNIFGGLLSFIAIIIISFYLSVMKQGIGSFLKSVAPEKYEEYTVSLWRRSERKVGRWLQGQLLLSLSVGLMVFVGLSLFHIKYALLLGIIAMFLEIIPVAGPVISAIPGIVLAFSQSPTLGIWVAIFYIVVQQIESHVFTPLILGKTLGLNPITVIIALLIGAKIAGILGIILAVPAAVVIVEILEDMARQKESRRSAAA